MKKPTLKERLASAEENYTKGVQSLHYLQNQLVAQDGAIQQLKELIAAEEQEDNQVSS